MNRNYEYTFLFTVASLRIGAVATIVPSCWRLQFVRRLSQTTQTHPAQSMFLVLFVLVVILRHAYHHPNPVASPLPFIAIVVRRSKNLPSDADTCLLQLRRLPGGQLLERAPEIYLCLPGRRESESAARRNSPL